MEYGPIEARLDRVQGDNAWITLGLREGKNREVKRILEHLGLQVNRLIRLSFGPFQLGEIEDGLVEEVKTKILRDQLGDALAEEAGVDFESPVREPIAPFGYTREGRTATSVTSAQPGRRASATRSVPAAGATATHERTAAIFARRGRAPTRDRGADARRDGTEKKPRRSAPRASTRRRSVWRAGDTDEDAPSKKMPAPRRRSARGPRCRGRAASRARRRDRRRAKVARSRSSAW